ncbi:MAG: sigma-54 dependent transcriptional regulator [bacterium]
MKREKVRVLVVDDHEEMVELLADQLRDVGYEVEVSTDGAAALKQAERRLPDVVITDLRMRGTDGFDVLNGIKALDSTIPVLIMTAFGAVDTAVEAIRRGASHYFTKPFKLDEVVLWVERALDDRNVREENRRLRATSSAATDALVGQSAAMLKVKDVIARIAQADVPVLLRGESGTGKEVVARAIHEAGPRAKKPFVAINCTSLPSELLESELFGHTKGAFTGATGARRGLFLEAEGGTLFLDEIGDMPPELQAKLLRVLQEREIRAVGSDVTRSVDVRVLAATHQPLEALVQAGRFRQDLMFRLDVLAIHLPPLRDRRDDIPLLVAYFAQKLGISVSPAAMERFVRYDWPGNVRELENVLHRYQVLGDDALDRLSSEPPAGFAFDKLQTLREVESAYIKHVLDHFQGNKTRAAEVLGVDVSTLHRREKAGG